MSNDSCAVVVKTHNEYYTDIIAGISNLQIKSETDVDGYLERMERNNGTFNHIDDAVEHANFLVTQYTRETGQPPVYGIIKFDWSKYV